MLTTLNLKVGSILHDMEQNIDHRVIYMNKDYLVTILINDSKGKSNLTNGILRQFNISLLRKKLQFANLNMTRCLTLMLYRKNLMLAYK